MTTEEQVAAVRAQVEREREGMRPEGWWGQAAGLEKRSRVVRFAGDAVQGRRISAQVSVGAKKRSVVMGGSGKSSRRGD